MYAKTHQHHLDYERRKLSNVQKCKTTFNLKEFNEYESIEWNLLVDSTPSPHHYDMILGHNVMSEHGIMLDFMDQTMKWDDSTINMKDPESLSRLIGPSKWLFLEQWSLWDRGTSRSFPSSPENSWCKVHAGRPRQGCTYVQTSNWHQKHQLHAYWANTNIHFDGTLGTWNKKPYNIKLKEGAKPYHCQPFLFIKHTQAHSKSQVRQTHQIGSVKVNQRQPMGHPNIHHFEKGCNCEVHFQLLQAQ